MDFDGVIERDGKFLGFETKTNGTPIPAGQRFTIEASLRQGWTWLVLEGKCVHTLQSMLVCPPGSTIATGTLHRPCAAGLVRDKVRDWFILANRGVDPDPNATEVIRWLRDYEREMGEEG